MSGTPGPGDTRVSSSQGGPPPAVTNDAVDEARVTAQQLGDKADELAALGSDVFQCKQDNEAVPAAVQKKLAAVGIYDSTDLDTVLAELKARLEKAVSIHEEAMKQHILEMQKAAQVPQKKYMDAELTELLERKTGSDDVYGSEVFGRDDAKDKLAEALKAPVTKGTGRSGVITTVGVPGSGKTFFLRAGILRKWYPRNSIMMTYNEGAHLFDDAKMDITTAFARQLVQSNCKNTKDVDFERIVDLDTVLAAFRLLLKLDDNTMLIVCVDELVCLRTGLERRLVAETGDTEKAATRAHARCQNVRSQLMAYQDSKISRQSMKVCFVWTSLTDYFDADLQKGTYSLRTIMDIPLAPLDDAAAWALAGKALKDRSAKDPALLWGFHLCAGNPRALVDGLGKYTKLYKDRAGDRYRRLTLPPALADEILEAWRFGARGNYRDGDVTTVSSIFANVLTGQLPEPSLVDSLMMRGVLNKTAHGVHFLHPSLVYKWAKGDTDVQKVTLRYIESGRVANDPKLFEEQTFLFEQMLNCAYRELNPPELPTLAKYFGGAFVHADLQEFRVHPRQHVGEFTPDSLIKNIESVHAALEDGKTVYSYQENEKGVDVLIPLWLSKTGEDAVMHVFCGQNKLVDKRIENLGDVEMKVQTTITDLKLNRAHGLYFTTHGPELETENRTGVWFTRDPLERWLGRMGMPLCTMKRKAPPASNVLRSWTPRWDATRALPAVHQAWLSPQLPLAAPRNAVNLLLLRRAAKVFS